MFRRLPDAFDWKDPLSGELSHDQGKRLYVHSGVLADLLIVRESIHALLRHDELVRIVAHLDLVLSFHIHSEPANFSLLPLVLPHHLVEVGEGAFEEAIHLDGFLIARFVLLSNKEIKIAVWIEIK